MGGQMPSWLEGALVEALHDVGATAPEAELRAEAIAILARWDTPGRPIRNGRFLAALFENLDEVVGAISDPAALRLAAAYHGALSDPLTTFLGAKFGGRPSDSTYVATRLVELGVPDETAERIREIITKVSGPELPTDDLDAQILLDANLAVFAVSPQAYSKICKGLRQISSLDDRRFLQARRAHLSRLLGRPRLFLTPFGARWAGAVRENLEGELSQIDSRLTALTCADEESSASLEADDIDGNSPAEIGVAASKISDNPSSGPIVIRSSRVQKRERLDQQRAATETETNPAGVALAETETDASIAQQTRDQDETSTLETFDDPFSHKRVPRE